MLHVTCYMPCHAMPCHGKSCMPLISLHAACYMLHAIPWHGTPCLASTCHASLATCQAKPCDAMRAACTLQHRRAHVDVEVAIAKEERERERERDLHIQGKSVRLRGSCFVRASSRVHYYLCTDADQGRDGSFFCSLRCINAWHKASCGAAWHSPCWGIAWHWGMAWHSPCCGIAWHRPCCGIAAVGDVAGDVSASVAWHSLVAGDAPAGDGPTGLCWHVGGAMYGSTCHGSGCGKFASSACRGAATCCNGARYGACRHRPGL